jgi:hypothetical protein
VSPASIERKIKKRITLQREQKSFQAQMHAKLLESEKKTWVQHCHQVLHPALLVQHLVMQMSPLR